MHAYLLNVYITINHEFHIIISQLFEYFEARREIYIDSR